MKINVVNSFLSEAPLLIIPVKESENLDIELDSFANKYQLNAELLKKEFKAGIKECFTLFSPTLQKIVFLGLGKKPISLDYVKVFRTFVFQNKTKLSSFIQIDFRNFDSQIFEYVQNGIMLGGYNLPLYKTNERTNNELFKPTSTLEYLTSGGIEEALNFAKRGKTIGKTQLRVFDLMNAPSNYKTPQFLADWAVKSGNENGFLVKVFDELVIANIGLKALESVSLGSKNSPRFIVMEYNGAKNNAKSIGLVGKGVTFDTGGVSIKSSNNMHLMKSDMGGAAAVLGTLELAAKLKLAVNLIGIIPATENSVDGNAIKPGDVIGSYSGKTIEVVDTDAEGRVILADGISYLLKNYQPDILIDLATLTGSCVATLGYHAGGMFANNDHLAKALIDAGMQTGERLWQLPLWDVYKEDIASDIADIRNFSGKPMAGAISAAKFIEFFIENHQAWAHLDIAGVAFGDTEYAPQRMGTAFGVRLLLNYIENTFI